MCLLLPSTNIKNILGTLGPSCSSISTLSSLAFCEKTTFVSCPVGQERSPQLSAPEPQIMGRSWCALGGLNVRCALTLLGLGQQSGRYLQCFVQDIGGRPRLLRELSSQAGKAVNVGSPDSPTFEDTVVGSLYIEAKRKVRTPPHSLLHFTLAGIPVPDLLLPDGEQLNAAKNRLKTLAPSFSTEEQLTSLRSNLELGYVPYIWDTDGFRIDPSIVHLSNLVCNPDFAALRPVCAMPFLSSSLQGGSVFELSTVGSAVASLNALRHLGRTTVDVRDWIRGVVGPEDLLAKTLEIPRNCRMGYEAPWLLRGNSTKPGVLLTGLLNKPGQQKPPTRKLRQGDSSVAVYGNTWPVAASKMTAHARQLLERGLGVSFQPGVAALPLAQNLPDVDWRLQLSLSTHLSHRRGQRRRQGKQRQAPNILLHLPKQAEDQVQKNQTCIPRCPALPIFTCHRHPRAVS